MERAAIASLCVVAACGGATTPARERAIRDATVDELVRVRCALDGTEVITTWSGAVLAIVPGERPARLFDVVGMNVARCLRADDGWHLTSRELLYYLDPATGQPLDRWTNPWTDEEVPVVHVANRLVQGGPFGPVPMRVAGDTATVVLDIPLFYPNALAADEALRPYAPAPTYQAVELFTLVARAGDVADADLATVPAVTFAWHRVGPWLPWMKAGDRAGYLVYSAHGEKVGGLADLPPLLQRELADRVPLYRHAPACLLPGPNVTSWSYFAAHLAEYQAGARFPLPAPEEPDECAAAR